MEYEILDEKTVVSYLRNRPELAAVFPDPENLIAREVGDGNLNLVFIIENEKNTLQSAILKQALPYLRVAGESWMLTRERMRFESQALQLYNDLVPGLAPEVYEYNEEMSLVVMEYLGEHVVMRKPLVERKQFPYFADHISTFLARVLFKTSDLYLTGLQKKTLQSKFINPHLCKIQEDFVFTNPYMESKENNWNPEIDSEVRTVRQNTSLKQEIAELKAAYMTHQQALIHSDLHTGSIMVNAHDTRVIDPEFSFFGPMGYDIGALLSNLMLNYASHYAHTPDTQTRTDYQMYLVDMIRNIWIQFANKFEALWIENNTGELVPNAYWQYPGGEEAFAGYRSDYLRRLLQDTAGLGACESLRRIMGIVSVWDISSIQDNRVRAVAERFVIKVSTRWITERKSFNNIEDLIGIIQDEAQNISIG